MGTNAKRRSALWVAVLAGTFWGAVGAGPVPVYAQKPPAAASAASPVDQDISSVDAQRGALDRFLDAHPEVEREVSGRPSLMSDPNYLRRHPELEAFLGSHPLVKADPRAFISPGAMTFHQMESGDTRRSLVPFSVFICFLLAFLWVVRTNRRWNRTFKMHEELHGKLIEKFASGQDFNAYLQSDTATRGLPNPVGRILRSLQAGLVLFLVGLGLLVLRSVRELSDLSSLLVLLLVFGTLGVTLGVGFILSAAASYGLSKHLGLIAGATQGSDSTLKR